MIQRTAHEFITFQNLLCHFTNISIFGDTLLRFNAAVLSLSILSILNAII